MPKDNYIQIRIDGIEEIENIPKGQKSAYLRKIIEEHFENRRVECDKCGGKGYIEIPPEQDV